MRVRLNSHRGDYIGADVVVTQVGIVARKRLTAALIVVVLAQSSLDIAADPDGFGVVITQAAQVPRIGVVTDVQGDATTTVAGIRIQSYLIRIGVAGRRRSTCIYLKMPHSGAFSVIWAARLAPAAGPHSPPKVIVSVERLSSAGSRRIYAMIFDPRP